jgi:tetratricopeptide (TPR) repeat protein
MRPKTYSVAVYLVALFIVAEIVMLGGIWWFRQSKVKLETVAPAPPANANTPSLNTKAPEVPIPNLPKPEIDGRLNVVPQNEKIVREVGRLNVDAQNFRQNGDFSLAETALNQALELDPNNPQTLANMAMLQEAMGNNEKALERWKSIIVLGDSAGKTIQLARERAAIIQQRVVLEQQARQREMSLFLLKRQIVIADVTAVPQTVTDSTPEVQVNFAIKRADAKLRIDPNKMRIQLYVYDRLADGRFIPAKSIEADFVEQPADWSKRDTEILHARYVLSQDAGGKRIPYGYLLRVYYNNELQDERADPIELLKIFPSNNSQQSD